MSRLTARKIHTAKPGKYSDGGNLYLVVSSTESRKWVLRFTWRGAAREMGLGSTSTVSLADARRKARDARVLLDQDKNPIDERRRSRVAVPTFGTVADEVCESLAHGFRNPKHRAQWVTTLRTYAVSLRSKPIDALGTDDILAVLKPIWTTKPETASRVRGRIEKVLDAARAKGLRSGENPARWRGHLDHLLPKRQKLTRGHHPAMPYEEVPSFTAELRNRAAVAASALEFCILTAGRSGEVLGARWSEIDLESRLWTIPADRMKAGREHRVPLCARCLDILAAMAEIRSSPYVFPGKRLDRPLSNMAMDMVLRRMGRGDITVHGFRSSFRDWAGNVSSFPREIAEAALAHRIGDATERAYRRSDALEKRRLLIESWASFCERAEESNVVALTR